MCEHLVVCPGHMLGVCGKHTERDPATPVLALEMRGTETRELNAPPSLKPRIQRIRHCMCSLRHVQTLIHLLFCNFVMRFF